MIGANRRNDGAAPRTAAVLVAALALAAGCGDEGDGGGATAGGGGSGGSASSAGSGGAGGVGSPCLDASAHDDLFTIDDPALCAVASYTADIDLAFQVPSWGRHGGPVAALPGEAPGSVDIVRLGPPSGTSGALATSAITVGASQAKIPEGSFLGAQAIDLPFFGWTAISYSGQFPMTQGELILVREDADAGIVDERYPVNAFFSGVGLAAEGGHGRLLYSGLSGLEDATAQVNALYSADSCGGSGGSPARLVPAGDDSCGNSIAVKAWGDASGPVAADRDGNVFAVMTSFDGTQEARGFAAAAVARNQPPNDGSSMFEMAGFGAALAAIPLRDGESVLAFQPFDAMGNALDVVGQRYRVEEGAIAPGDAPAPILKLAKAGTAVSLFSDDEGRLWVSGPGDVGTMRFVVLAAAPAHD